MLSLYAEHPAFFEPTFEGDHAGPREVLRELGRVFKSWTTALQTRGLASSSSDTSAGAMVFSSDTRIRHNEFRPICLTLSDSEQQRLSGDTERNHQNDTLHGAGFSMVPRDFIL